jgi:nicotinamidase-related amidase
VPKEKTNQEVPLLIVDVQCGFINSSTEHILPMLGEVAKRWIDRGWPIYMSQFTNFSGSQWERLLGWYRFQSDADVALHPSLSVLVPYATVFRKRSYTCLIDPFLSDLARHSWAEVALCGIATDGCVLATAKDLFEFAPRPIRPVVLEDLCASHAGAEVHREGLHLIQRFIGRDQIVRSDEYLSEDSHSMGVTKVN